MTYLFFWSRLSPYNNRSPSLTPYPTRVGHNHQREGVTSFPTGPGIAASPGMHAHRANVSERVRRPRRSMPSSAGFFFLLFPVSERFSIFIPRVQYFRGQRFVAILSIRKHALTTGWPAARTVVPLRFLHRKRRFNFFPGENIQKPNGCVLNRLSYFHSTYGQLWIHRWMFTLMYWLVFIDTYT